MRNKWGMWAWLSWIKASLSSLGLWSGEVGNTPRTCPGAAHTFGRKTFTSQLTYWVLTGLSSLWILRLRVSAPRWLLARGRPQFLLIYPFHGTGCNMGTCLHQNKQGRIGDSQTMLNSRQENWMTDCKVGVGEHLALPHYSAENNLPSSVKLSGYFCICFP